MAEPGYPLVEPARAKPYIIHTYKYELVKLMVEVYERGQIVIPKYIRDMLHIKPGTQLNAHVEGSRIILEQFDFAQELDAFRAKYATMTDEEVDVAIKKSEEKMYKEWLDVYRR
ncbi:MAG: AbrB/MazE/SpoVT family DNA-binding domain-containing protein [Deltaproteobacteria bacterium]|nr:AbrB/MazE/SpoVT family DNA-binding domain-containing protein [Deltaproteobacteria bacterium]